jgi:hypothetical protein
MDHDLKFLTSGPKVIFDADMSSDWDDIGAIAALHALADLGECEIIGMMVSSTDGGAANSMDVIGTYYGRPNIPVGVRSGMNGPAGFNGTLSVEFPHDLNYTQCPPATTLYRQLLAGAADNSITIIATGYLTNLRTLLESPADSISPLNGLQLVAQKVKLLSCMGGSYPSGGEFNFKVTPDDTYVVVNQWPAAVIYSGSGIGTPLGTGGRLMSKPAGSPIRRVWELKGGADHPSYDQTAVYYAVRANEGLWNTNTTGHNTAIANGNNTWATDVDPNGLQEQGYLLERGRAVVQNAIDVLMMAEPKVLAMTTGIPTQPTYLRATAASISSVFLQWTDNAYNETGFDIEIGRNGVFTSVGSVGANVTSFMVSSLEDTNKKAFRVRAKNANGVSAWTYVWLYSGWTEINYTAPTNLPLYAYFRSCDLRWDRGGDYKPDHVTLNNDSTHSQNFTLKVDVGATGANGNFYVYFFYNDANNWYRLNVSPTLYQFEKKVAGVITSIGSSVTVVSSIGNGTYSQAWQIQCSDTGVLTYSLGGTQTLSVTDSLSFTTGQLGLGGNARTPLWENFNFVIG